MIRDRTKIILLFFCILILLISNLGSQDRQVISLNYSLEHNLYGINIQRVRANGIGLFAELIGGVTSFVREESDEWLGNPLIQRNKDYYLSLNGGFVYQLYPSLSLYLGMGRTWIQTRLYYLLFKRIEKEMVIKGVSIPSYLYPTKKYVNVVMGIIYKIDHDIFFLPSKFSIGYSKIPRGITIGFGFSLLKNDYAICLENSIFTELYGVSFFEIKPRSVGIFGNLEKSIGHNWHKSEFANTYYLSYNYYGMDLSDLVLVEKNNRYIILNMGLTITTQSLITFYLGGGTCYIEEQWGHKTEDIPRIIWEERDPYKKLNLTGGILVDLSIFHSFIPLIFQIGFNTQPLGVNFGIGRIFSEAQ